MTTNRRKTFGVRKGLCVGAAVALLAGCASNASSTPASSSSGGSTSGASQSASVNPSDVLVVSINKLGSTQYVRNEQAGLKDTADKFGIQSHQIDVATSATDAITQVQTAITEGAKGITITVPDQKIGPQVLALAKAANIPVIATDDPISDSSGQPAPWVGFDGTEMGTQVGKEAANIANKEGWSAAKDKIGVLSVVISTLSVCNQRTDAATAQVLAGVPGLTKSDVFQVPYDGTEDAALKAAPGVITAHPDVKKWIVYSCSDEGVGGALQALSAAGFKSADEVGVGLDGDFACKVWKSGIDTGMKAALYLDAHSVGQIAMTNLFNFITKGTPIPAKSLSVTKMVHPNDYVQNGDVC